MTAARRFARALGVCAAFTLAVHAISLSAQQRTIQPTKFTRAPMIQALPPGEVEVLPIRGNLYALFGAGSNIVASVGPDGVMLVDAGKAGMTDKIIAAVQQMSRDWSMRNEPKALGWGAETRSSVADRHITAPPKPIRYVMNTTVDADHVGGNEKLRNAGRTFTGGNVAGDIRDSTQGAAILAHENVLTRLAAGGGEGQSALTADALPTDTYFEEFYKLSHYFNGEGVQLFHMPKAHTDGDSIVFFRGTDVIAMGDLMSTGSYPVIDVAKGGTINGVVDGLNRVIDMSQTEFRLEGGTLMVPGHGRMVDSADVAYYRDMLTIIRDRVAAMVKKNMTLDQVIAANPTGDYDTEYGSTTGSWTTRQFVEAVYKTLGGGSSPAAPAKRPARKP
ncbi:MAG TPA: MBL fold metallo-hydrolase [Vicinamibacterales bacterium]|jgi:glyoxylase-like metal-dependent hydrolase (beta-lactamase superfamily II)